MKKILGIAFFVIICSFSVQELDGQSLKFGHINRNELIQAMPEFDSANVQLQNYRDELVNQLELLTVEFNNKNDAYTKEAQNLTDIVRQTKEQELYDMNRRIQEFQEKASADLQNKQVELFQPITTKADQAIQTVGKENGFVYIFDVSAGQLVYFDESKSSNVLALVKTRLGIK